MLLGNCPKGIKRRKIIINFLLLDKEESLNSEEQNKVTTNEIH